MQVCVCVYEYMWVYMHMCVCVYIQISVYVLFMYVYLLQREVASYAATEADIACAGQCDYTAAIDQVLLCTKISTVLSLCNVILFQTHNALGLTQPADWTGKRNEHYIALHLAGVFVCVCVHGCGCVLVCVRVCVSGWVSTEELGMHRASSYSTVEFGVTNVIYICHRSSVYNVSFTQIIRPDH